MRNLVKLQWGSKSNLGVYLGLVSAWTNKDDEKEAKKELYHMELAPVHHSFSYWIILLLALY
jgi:hypothetical protein